MAEYDWLLLVAAGVLFYLLAKISNTLCVIAIVIAALWYGAASIHSAWEQRAAAKKLQFLKIKHREDKIYAAVNITAAFDDKICSQQNGLLVKIMNNSNVTIAYVGWKLSVYQLECSGCPTKEDEKIVSYRTLRPQTEHLACYHTPILQNNYSPRVATYAVVRKEVQPIGEKIITDGSM